MSLQLKNLNKNSIRFKVIIFLCLFFLVFASLGLISLVLLDHYNKKVQSLVLINNSFLSLNNYVSQYREFGESNGVFKDKYYFSKQSVQHISSLHQELNLSILKEVRNTISFIDRVQEIIKDKQLIGKMKYLVFEFQEKVINDLEHYQKIYNSMLVNNEYTEESILNSNFEKELNVLDKNLMSLNNDILNSIELITKKFKKYISFIFYTNIIVFFSSMFYFTTLTLRRLKIISKISMSLKTLAPLPKIKSNNDEIGIIIKSLNDFYYELSQSFETIREKENLLQESNFRLKELNKSLVDTIENERLDISQFIHNNLGQYLTSMQLQLNFLKLKFKDQYNLNENIEYISRLILECLSELKKVSSSIQPPLIEEFGLKKSLNHLIKSFSEYKFKIIEEIKIDEKDLTISQKVSIYRIIQEALLNVARHAFASNVIIKSKTFKNYFFVIIKDDGVGLKDDFVFSTGLKVIESRINYLMGKFRIKSNYKKGITLQISIPLD